MQDDSESGSPVGSSGVVLIADDDEPIAQALAYIVEECGGLPLVAAHGRQALELALTYHPALIITDLMMPQMTGAELMAALRADAAVGGYRPAAIVLMSAAGTQYMDSLGADAVLPKPFDLTDVEALIERFLPRAQREP
ncbi:MAG TPA: response regulator [Ktedonobacterales bacterium]|nr:response regulator [Ktedonobacterales bacterium]